MNLTTVDELRLEASKLLDPTRKSELGQFMTPSNIARFMVELFGIAKHPVRLLDAGAGVGSLTSAFLGKQSHLPVTVDAWEIDPTLRHYLSHTLARYSNALADIHASDFIEEAVLNLATGKGKRYTHAILNPPYKKISSHSKHRLLLRKVRIETVNLYTAFLALAILLMERGGEIVAIVPRSFCNGPYYRPFRDLLLHHCAIRHIHVFEARNKAFAEDEVLQENIIIKLEKNGIQGEVTVSDCHDATFSDYREQDFSFRHIVKPGDAESFIHIPALDRLDEADSPLFAYSLNEIGLEVCTGPVVDFRLKAHCLTMPDQDAAPLIYAHHFADGRLTFPIKHKKKPNAILIKKQTQKCLMPKGYYVLVKRFSAKEERRRIVACVVNPDELEAPFYGFENHLNVFHINKHGMDKKTAYGLALFLNASIVDACFRAFSGHTQVNATDLRQMRYPSRDTLKTFGQYAIGKRMSQAEVDEYIQQSEQHAE
jgi:adenine-specific DNA-methyltransferase